MTTDFLLNFTPNGMIPTKSMPPHVSVNPQEIITDVLEATI
jgi:3-keto-5-aminohexanoate cleavage enzyme